MGPQLLAIGDEGIRVSDDPRPVFFSDSPVFYDLVDVQTDGFIGSCCKITQKLTDKKESTENERVLDHWRTEHNQLKLYDIE